MDLLDLRSRFRHFAGSDRYRKFVRSINRVSHVKGRLLYWQERLWADFVSGDAPAYQSADPFAVFGVCDIHERSLQAPRTGDRLSEIRDTPEADEAMENAFPFAGNGDRLCAECRVARERWIAEHHELCRILRCRTTCEDFCTRHFGTVPDFAESLLPRIKERSQEIAAQMEPGDELWEWDGGGWHHLAGRAGLAVVRAGQIVQQWCFVKS
jgi:hypothetical protein